MSPKGAQNKRRFRLGINLAVVGNKSIKFAEEQALKKRITELEIELAAK